MVVFVGVVGMCCSLGVVGCWLPLIVVSCSFVCRVVLLVCWLLIVVCWLFGIRNVLFVVCLFAMSSIVNCSFVVVRCLLRVTCRCLVWLLFVVG